MNKPSNVGFSDRDRQRNEEGELDQPKELIGSTKIVILFMFLIAHVPVRVDTIFGWSSI